MVTCVGDLKNMGISVYSPFLIFNLEMDEYGSRIEVELIS